MSDSYPPVGSKWRLETDVTVLDVRATDGGMEVITFEMQGSKYRWFLSAFLAIFTRASEENE
jgi:hypothetical protein